MTKIVYSDIADRQLDNILSSDAIYDSYGHFTQTFLKWNRIFHKFVNLNAMNGVCNNDYGIYRIGGIGVLVYRYMKLSDSNVILIQKFDFNVLPYSHPTYNVVGDAGYGYKIVQHTNNKKYSILTPSKRLLCKIIFDGIIGFHHSSDDYNVVHAIGFINDRCYSILMNGDVFLFPYSKEQYLSMKHKYYESKIWCNTKILTEADLYNIIKLTVRKILNETVNK